MKSIYFRFILVLILAVSLLPTTGAVAESPADGQAKLTFDDAESLYLKLQKTDPGVQDMVEWEKAASELLAYARQQEQSKYQVRAFFDLGRLYETTFRKRHFRTSLSRAVYFYEQVAKTFRGDPLADDALLALGDLRRNELKDEAAARAAYYEIVDVYKNSDNFKKAQERLGEVSSSKPAERSPGKKKKAEEKKEETNPAVKVPKASPDKQEAKEATAIEKELVQMAKAGDVGEEGKEIVSRQSDLKRPMIVIDPGHGGKEEGAHGPDGSFEKDVVLNIALLLDELLRERLRARTLLTRARDVDLSLGERTKIANDQDADLFISIHTNASEFRNATGIETYYLDNTNDKSSLRLAERENEPMTRENSSDLGFMVSDLIQNAKQPDSIALAHLVQDSLFNTLSRYYRGVKSLGVKKAPFYVLVGAHMPCILVEVSFIDHPVEGPRLIRRRYQKLVALALYEGIRGYFDRRR